MPVFARLRVLSNIEETHDIQLPTSNDSCVAPVECRHAIDSESFGRDLSYPKRNCFHANLTQVYVVYNHVSVYMVTISIFKKNRQLPKVKPLAFSRFT